MRAAAAHVTVSVLLSSVLAGCPPAHVALTPAPRADAPPEARAHYYAQHKLTPAAREDLELRTRLFEDRPTVTRRAATLGSGVRIHYVEDLRPAVPARSATALAIDETEVRDGRADLLLAGGLAAGGAGLAVALALVAVELGVAPEVTAVPSPRLSPLLFGAAGAFMVGVAGGGALATWGMAERDEADRARARAFATYEADLRDALGVQAGAAPAAP